MELHKLHIFVLQTGARGHRGAIARARVRRSTAEVRPAGATGRQDCVLSLEPFTFNQLFYIKHCLIPISNV